MNSKTIDCVPGGSHHLTARENAMWISPLRITDHHMLETNLAHICMLSQARDLVLHLPPSSSNNSVRDIPLARQINLADAEVLVRTLLVHLLHSIVRLVVRGPPIEQPFHIESIGSQPVSSVEAPLGRFGVVGLLVLLNEPAILHGLHEQVPLICGECRPMDLVVLVPVVSVHSNRDCRCWSWLVLEWIGCVAQHDD